MGQAGSASRDDVAFPTNSEAAADLQAAGTFSAGVVASPDHFPRLG